MSLSLLLSLPTELIVAIAALLDARSLIRLVLVRPLTTSLRLLSGSLAQLTSLHWQTCKDLRDVVSSNTSLQYMLALAERGLCDGPPSSVTVMSRLELLKAHEEAWRTFSWTEHLTLDIHYPHSPPYVSAGTLVLPNHGNQGVKSFVVQSIPSPLRGIPGRHWQIELGFFADPFIIDATQDLLAVVPTYDTRWSVDLTTSASIFMRICSRELLPLQRADAHTLYLSATPPLSQRGYLSS
jgi:hypothetical protein